MTARPATGDVHQLRRGEATAHVGELAAVLRGFQVGGVAYTETWDDAELPPMGCGIVLVPWPNRIRDAKWTHRGAQQKLDITELSNGHATHGLLRNTAYRVVEQQDDRITLAASIYPQHGYPFILDTRVTYALDDQGLTVTHELVNQGTDPAPFGVGAHPYLRVGDHPVEDLVLTVPAATYAPCDERLIPVGREPVEGTGLDLRSGVQLGLLDADVALTDLSATAGRVEHSLAAPDGTGLVLWADEVFGWVQVFSPTNFPSPSAPQQRRAVAVEPMTCAADAFNNGWGLLTLEPGETWSASWGLRPVTAS